MKTTSFLALCVLAVPVFSQQAVRYIGQPGAIPVPVGTITGTGCIPSAAPAGQFVVTGSTTGTCNVLGIAPSANTQTFLAAANYAAMRTALGVALGSDVQAYSANLTTFAGITPSANIQSFLAAADYAAMRTALGLVIGTNVQAYNANLTTWAGIAPGSGVGTALAITHDTTGGICTVGGTGCPGGGSGGSMFVGSTATSTTGIGGTAAAPTITTADISTKSPHVFQMAQLTTNVTSVAITTSAGADLWIKWKQAASGGPYSVGGYVNLGADSLVCDTATVAAGKVVYQHIIVEADGTTLDGVGCTSNDPADAPPVSAKLTGTNAARQSIAASASDIAGVNYVAGGGTAQAQTATYTPAVTLTAGTRVCWLPTAANTAAAPTFAPNGLTAHTIVKAGGALVANDIITTRVACAIYDATGTQWELQNPQTATGGGATISSTPLLIKGDNAGNGVAAAAADVYGLFSGTHDSSHCTAGDGTMQPCAPGTGGGTVVPKTGNYTLLSTDTGNVYPFDAASATATAPATVPSMPYIVALQNNNASNNLTLARNGNTINKATGVAGTTDMTIPPGQGTTCEADTVTANNYVCSKPFLSGAGISLTPSAVGVTIATAAVPLTSMATQAANTSLANVTGSTAAPTAVALPAGGTSGCAGATDVPLYTAGTGWSCTQRVIAHGLGASFVNSGSALSGTTVFCEAIPFTGTITDVYTTGDISGSATLGIKTVASGSYTGVAGYSGYTSIVASAPPSLSGATYYHDATLTGWTLSLTKGQMICFQVSSPATLTSLTVNLVYTGSL